MTDRTVLGFNPGVLASALNTLSDLMLDEGRVAITPIFDPDICTTIDTVKIDVTGCPAERDELVAVLGDPPAHDWQGGGTGYWYRDWSGVLLTMPVLVIEVLPEPTAAVEPTPPASDPAGDVVPTPAPVPICLGIPTQAEAACGELGPHGRHELGDDPPPVVSDYVTPAGEVVVTIVDGPIVKGTGYGWADLLRPSVPPMERFRLWAADEQVPMVRTFADAIGIVDGWQWRALLSDEDANHLADELVMPEPEPISIIRGRPYVQWARVIARMRNRSNRHRADEPEHAAAVS